MKNNEKKTQEPNHYLVQFYSPSMATIILFILLTLTSTIHARESQFFNKFSNKESQPLNTNQQPQQQPDFIPQSQDTGSYGLYGNNNKNNNLPENYNPVAYTTPIHSSTQYIPNELNDPQTYQYNGESRMYNSEKQGFDDARFVETEDGGNMYNSQKQGMRESTTYNDNNNMYNNEKQGMSDTRFLENGKYFYDVNMENNNYNANMNTQGYNGNTYDRYSFNGGGGDQFNP